VPAFDGKIEAGFTVRCKDPDLAEINAVGAPRSAATMAAALAAVEDECVLVPGIAAKANPLAELEHARLAWNAALQAGQPLSPVQGVTVRDIEERVFATSFHGTATAAAIATGNDDVRLVLVERGLGDVDSQMKEFKCITQEQVDSTVAALTDPAVRTMYVQQPLTSMERDLRQAIVDHHVDVVSESFGGLSREALEQWLAEKGCEAINLRPYYQAFNDFQRDVEAHNPQPLVLVVKSAGNDGVRIDDGEDSIDCRKGYIRHLTVGAYGPGQVHSDFTNRGECVDVYGPGESILLPVPGNWLLPLDGTSFSAPLVARLMARIAPAPFNAESARALALSLADENGDISNDLFPAALEYSPKVTTVRQGLSEGAPAARRHLPVNQRELRKFLGRIRLLGN
jgi:hypothetical protein